MFVQKHIEVSFIEFLCFFGVMEVFSRSEAALGFQERCRVDIDQWGRIFCPELLDSMGGMGFTPPKMVESLPETNSSPLKIGHA